MEHQPDPVQTLLLWNLAANQGSAWLADLKSTLTGKSRRTSLIRDGLMTEEKRPRVRAGMRTVRSIHLTLEDKGWAWLADHLDAPVSQSKAAADVLQGLLGIVGAHLERNQLALADFMAMGAESVTEPPLSQQMPTSEAEPDDGSGEMLEARIAAAYAALAHHRSNDRVRLADLRRQLTDVPRKRVDAALRNMTSDGRVVLNRLDNPLEITAEDEAAKLVTGLGHPRHILHMEILAHV